MTTTVNLLPFWALVAPVLQNILVVAAIGGLLAVSHRIPLISAAIQIIGAPLVEQKFAEAISFAVAKITPDIGTIDVRSSVLAMACSWLLAQIPGWLTLFGLTQTQIETRIEALLPGHADYAALVAALPATNAQPVAPAGAPGASPATGHG